MSDTEINVSTPKLSAFDSDILARFQQRVVRVEFVRSVSPMELRTILHITPETDAPDA